MARRPEMTGREIRHTLRELRAYAWADETPDALRVPMWNAYDALRQQRREIEELRKQIASSIASALDSTNELRDRLARQAVHLERAEADNERLHDAFARQKGGAA